MRGEKDFHRRLRRYLDSIGATHVAFSVTGGTHMRCRFKYEDRPLMMICSATPSDHRAEKKAKCLIRRLIRHA
jgi:hypothetical protein